MSAGISLGQLGAKTSMVITTIGGGAGVAGAGNGVGVSGLAED
jgi:hypothetical protein